MISTLTLKNGWKIDFVYRIMVIMSRKKDISVVQILNLK